MHHHEPRTHLNDLEHQKDEITSAINDTSNAKELHNLSVELSEINDEIGKYKEQLRNDNFNINTVCVLLDTAKTESEMKKRDMHHTHHQKVDDALSKIFFTDNPQPKGNAQENDYCCSCGVSGNIEITDGIRVCRSCGFIEKIITEHYKSPYKDSAIPRTVAFSYKKLNHFKEWISQIQGKEVTKIPKELFMNIFAEIKKECINDMSKITQKKVRGYLKKLKQSKYYEHVAYITAELGGERPPIIPQKVEDILQKMFIDVSAPFLQYCPNHRRNFPRYTYIIYKCCEIIGFTKILPYLPLLKTRVRLIEMDQIWKKVTEILHYPYIPTVG